MDITPVIELRERLKVGAVAGSGLAAADFRLKRAVEALEPLMAASPVFARLGQLARQVIQEDCPDRAGALLDAITLADALLCTQGKVEVAGELEALGVEEEEEAEDMPVVNVPYSVLSTLLDALTHSGNGRYGYVMELRREHPELFQDYRVRTAMVQALGASYAELAEAVAGWLVEDGKTPKAGAGNGADGSVRKMAGRGSNLLPLLKKGFDPKGKKEMVRRVQVLERIAGAGANDFYLEQLPQAEKEVRGALLYALRHSQENQETLLHLAATERGNNQKMACCALAFMEGEKVWEYFDAQAQKKPVETVLSLEQSRLPGAEEVMAKIFCSAIRKWQQEGGKPSKEMEPILDACLHSLAGKSGHAACDCYRLGASVGTGLDVPVENGKDGREVMTFVMPDNRFRMKKSYFSQVLPRILQLSVLLCPAGEGNELMSLARELYETYGDPYFPAAMGAALRTGTGDMGLGLLEDFVEEKKLLGKRIRRDRAGLVAQALLPIHALETGEGYECSITLVFSGDFQPETFRGPMPAISDGMLDVLMELEDTGTDQVLASWIRPEDTAQCGRLATYFHKRALEAEDNRMYLEPMRRCGAQDCSHMAVRYFSRNKGRIYNWQMENYLEQLPGSAVSRLEEARRLLELLKEGKLKAVNGGTANGPLEEFIQRMQFESTQG